MKEIMGFSPKIIEDFFVYRRTEPDGSETLKVGSSTIPTKIVNRQFSEVINFCNGENSILEMIEIQCATYNSVSREIIERDINYVIQVLTEMGALSNERNPFFQKVEKRIENDYLVVNSSYSYYLKLRDFIGKRTSIEKYRNPISNGNLISSLVNGRFFSEPVQGYYFHILKGERLVGIIVWGSLIPTIYSLEYISFLAIDDDTVKKSIEASIELLNTISHTKNSFSIQFDEVDTSSTIFNLFKNNKSLVLRNEYELNKDIFEVKLS